MAKKTSKPGLRHRAKNIQHKPMQANPLAKYTQWMSVDNCGGMTRRQMGNN